MASRTLFSSLFGLRCPRCRVGKLFQPGKLAKPGSLFEMHTHCACCQLSFTPEPGFYFGAMFVSYGINTAQFFGAWVALLLLYPDYSLALLLSILVAVVLISLPFTFRLSRSIWLTLFVSYDTSYAEKETH